MTSIAAKSSSMNGLPAAGEQCVSAEKLQLIGRLLESLNTEKIDYCHWKSNFTLAEALQGAGDLDLLIAREDAERFRGTLAQLGFKPAIDPAGAHLPGVFHYYGLDQPSSVLVHLHVYFGLTTGESLLKNYRLPLERMLLQNTRTLHGVTVPQKGAELIIFVIRAMLKYASWTECLLLKKNGDSFSAELKSLLQDGAGKQAEELLQRWLPSLDVALFGRCIACLQQDRNFWQRVSLGRKVKKRLAGCRRFGAIQEVILRFRIIGAALWRRRMRRRRGGKQLASGGAVIALIGPDACGKSTMVKETADFLGKVFQVDVAHLGKPRSTLITWLPTKAGKMLKRFLQKKSEAGTKSIEEMASAKPKHGLLYKIRAVMLAWDRLALVKSLARNAGIGRLVICDRYPSPTIGAMDGARLTLPSDGAKDRLAEMENRLYQMTVPPDVLVQLTTPVEVALQRNRDRSVGGSEDETDEYIAQRHSNVILPNFANTRFIRIDTNRSREDTILEVRRQVWELL